MFALIVKSVEELFFCENLKEFKELQVFANQNYITPFYNVCLLILRKLLSRLLSLNACEWILL